ncbi:MAG: radical SAM protein, partial [Candidatus Omnitrophota bacterium]
EGLKYVYIGNVPGHSGENTYCPRCYRLLIERVGYFVKENNIVYGKCKFCGEEIPGVWGSRR